MKRKNNYLAILIILLISLLLSGCVELFNSGNEPLQIVSNPSKQAIMGKLYTYQVEVEDDRRVSITYSLTAAPEGMNIDKLGLITWTPTEEQLGKHEVSIMVSGGFFRRPQTYSLAVTKKQLSSISVKPTTMSFANTNLSKGIESITARYTDGTTKIIANAECVFVSQNTSFATVDKTGKVTSKAKGNTAVSVSYTEEGITKSANITVTITAITSGGG